MTHGKSLTAFGYTARLKIRGQPMSRTALVAGATGLTGGMLLKELVARRDYGEVRVIGRRPPSHGAAGAGKVRFVASDFTNLGTLAADLAIDDVFCCLGTTIRAAGSQAAFERVDYHMVLELARAAKAAGAKQFLVVSSVGASLGSPAFYSRVKARMERAVAEVGFDATHIVRPSLLLGPRDEWVSQKIAPLLGLACIGPLKKYRPVEAKDVALSLVTLALRNQRGVHVHHLPLGD
jgi:uncharacterized protein YbjT (DUF2867 family)